MEEIKELIAKIKPYNPELLPLLNNLEHCLQKSKKVEKALQNSEARFRSLTESSPALIFVFQKDRMHYVNPAFVALTEYSETECLNMHFSQFIHPDFRDMVRARGQARLSGEPVPPKYETRLLAKSGKVIWVALHATLTKLGNHPTVFGWLFDISERKEFEEAIRKSEVLYRTIFETTGTAMMIFDQDMLISLVNSEFEKLSGYSKEEIHYKKLWPEFICQNDLKRMKEYHRLRRISPELVPSTYEFSLLNKAGEQKDIFITVDLIPNTSDSVVSFMDISERNKAEAQVKYLSFNDKLTGLYNRAFFDEELHRLNTPRQLPLSLIIGDVNGLKLINDALGHETGDQLLKIVAGILKKSCRQEDIIARWGGDEFIILLPRTDQETALKICERIKENSGRTEELPIPISISLGMASISAPRNMHKLIKEAEDKMYRNKLLESKSARSSFVTSLENSLREKSHETEVHCHRLRIMAEKVGKTIALPDGELDNLKLLATLHDIGKIAVSNSILNKAEPLSLAEWEIIKKHPETGYRIALTLPELAPIAEAILTHHEHWDGSGYPLGLSEQEIPLISRILAIVDAFDVMIQGRPYKKAISAQEAFDELESCAGSQFDPLLIQHFINLGFSWD
ncbi:MAG: PAS domain S-box protein [Syntrophomonadaceae bacterium]|nr:PAS domain S-box protein [Syntrophomonadaceae bacterium]